MYLFWVFVALKFKSRSFGDLDHFNGTDKTTKYLKKRNPLYFHKLIKEDLELGKTRRITYIKYWRQKFQSYITEAR